MNGWFETLCNVSHALFSLPRTTREAQRVSLLNPLNQLFNPENNRRTRFARLEVAFYKAGHRGFLVYCQNRRMSPQFVACLTFYERLL